jgi:ribulose-phosphate 3-epimerase
MPTIRSRSELSPGQVLICPSILSADFAELGDALDLVRDDADWIHVDVMDGMFVPNITIGMPVVHALRRRTDLPLDVHLMIVDPGRYVEAFVQAGADMLTVHGEACQHLHRVIQTIHASGARAGVALNPATPLSTIEEILPEVDMVLLMSVNPGFGGQKYIESVTTKIRALRAMMDARGISALIQVDGGLSTANVREVVSAGADVLVVGNSIYGTKDPVGAIRMLRVAAENVR